MSNKPQCQSRKRQKKGEVQGQFKCNVCSKEYLSYPAVYTHVKSKHPQQVDCKDVISRPAMQSKRGRPKKEEVEPDLIPNQQQAPLALQVQIECKQCVDDMLLDLWEMGLKDILLSESDIRNIEEITDSLQQTCQYLQQTDPQNFGNEQYDSLLQLFKEQMENTNTEDDFKIDEGTYRYTVDQSLCMFLKELSLTLAPKFLQQIELLLLLLRNYLNKQIGFIRQSSNDQFQQTQSKTQQLFCQKETPAQICQSLNDFTNVYLSAKLQNPSFLKNFYKNIRDTNDILSQKEFSDKVIRTIMLYYCNWLFYRRLSTHKLSFNDE